MSREQGLQDGLCARLAAEMQPRYGDIEKHSQRLGCTQTHGKRKLNFQEVCRTLQPTNRFSAGVGLCESRRFSSDKK